jgi:hypothetical protein
VRTARFYQVLLRECAKCPSLSVEATLADEGAARAIATSVGLSVDGRVVTGHPHEPAGVARFADESWEELALTSASRPLLAAQSREDGVKVWLDEHQAAQLQEALAVPLADEKPSPSRSRTGRAALLIALDWILLATVILVGVLVYRAAGRVTATWVAILVGIAVAAPLLWPMQAMGKRLQRRYYGSMY